MEANQWYGLYCLWISIVALLSIIITTTDIRYYWIPDETVFFFIIANGAAFFLGFISIDFVASISIILFFLILYVIYPGGMGSGDVKLAAALSLGLSLNGALTMIVIAFLLACVGALLVKWLHGSSIVPFGPFLLFGWWYSLLVHFNLVPGVL